MKNGLLFLMLIGFASLCFSKAYFAPKKEMIQKTECIVLVEITKVEKATEKGKTWTYSQRASATVKQCFKGDVKGTIEIFGMENFACAQCQYTQGTFILFLRKDEGFWSCSNWHLGIRPVKGEKVEWFKNDENPFEMKEATIADVIQEIAVVIREQKKLTTK